MRDLAYIYGAEIHVFDMNGRVVGSSTPQLFQNGLLNHRMAPEVFFSDQTSYLLHEQIGTVKYFAAYTAFYNGCNVQIGYIAMPAFISQEAMDAEVDGLLARFLPPYIVVLLLMFLLSYTAAHRLVKPIRMMTKQMQEFRLGRKNIHIDYAYHDEVGELVDHYNELVDRVEQATHRLANSEREGAWRTMARQIAHEINNPLTPMKLSIQQLQRLKGQPDFEERFDKATRILVEQIDNLGRIASSFSTFAKVPEVRASKVDIAEKLCSIIALHSNNPNDVPVRYVGPDRGVIVWADGEQIQQVFTNLLKNALQAVGAQEDGDIIVRLQETQDEVCISVSDNGPGISDEIKNKIFTPNFTTKTNGTGLGLAISKHIVEGCGGHILFETSKKGTNFLVYLKK